MLMKRIWDLNSPASRQSCLAWVMVKPWWQQKVSSRVSIQAPGVVVSYTSDPEVQNGAKFRGEGLQIAAGVPLQVGEGPEFKTFRLGLFGLDKLKDVEATVARLQRAVDAVL